VGGVEARQRPGELVGPPAHLRHDLGLGIGREPEPQLDQVVPGARLVDPPAGGVVERALEQRGEGAGALGEVGDRVEDLDRRHRHLDRGEPGDSVLLEQPPDEVEVPLVVGVGVVGDQPLAGLVAG
jgi:hypothetical protein